MPIVVWPADAVAGAPSYTGEMLRQTTNAAWSANSTRPLGAMSCIHPDTPSTFVSASSSTWTVTPFRCILDLEASSTAGPYSVSVNSNQTGSVTAADATHARIDLISIQLSDPAEGDGTGTPGAVVQYTAGTPAASPVAPATPARSLALATITVPKVGGGSPATAIVALRGAAAGGIIRANGGGQFPAAPIIGQYVDDQTTGWLFRWDGSNWSQPALTPASGVVAVTPGLVPVDAAITGVITVPASVFPSRVIFFAQGKTGNAGGSRTISWDWDSVTGTVITADDASIRITAATSTWVTVTTMLCVTVPAATSATARLMYRASNNGFNTGTVMWTRSPIV